MSKVKSCITITFCDVGENHAGMEKIGKEFDECPFTYKKLVKLSKKYANTELVDLTNNDLDTEPACVLVIREYCEYHEDLFKELRSLKWDTKAKMKGRVVNKKARYNLCFADRSSKPDYEKGKGRVVSFRKTPDLNLLKTDINKAFDINLPVAEGNYYYDLDQCYIGYHGDSERTTVVGMRLGASMDLCYCWYKNFQPCGDVTRIKLNSGDLYIMSDKAVGRDWKRSSIYTLRHCANSKKIPSPPKKNKTKK